MNDNSKKPIIDNLENANFKNSDQKNSEFNEDKSITQNTEKGVKKNNHQKKLSQALRQNLVRRKKI